MATSRIVATVWLNTVQGHGKPSEPNYRQLVWSSKRDNTRCAPATSDEIGSSTHAPAQLDDRCSDCGQCRKGRPTDQVTAADQVTVLKSDLTRDLTEGLTELPRPAH